MEKDELDRKKKHLAKRKSHSLENNTPNKYLGNINSFALNLLFSKELLQVPPVVKRDERLALREELLTVKSPAPSLKVQI